MAREGMKEAAQGSDGRGIGLGKERVCREGPKEIHFNDLCRIHKVGRIIATILSRHAAMVPVAIRSLATGSLLCARVRRAV